jgi:hypothetical protein
LYSLAYFIQYVQGRDALSCKILVP